MNKKRSRNKLYRFIDTLFLLLPFILFIGGFIFYLASYHNFFNSTNLNVSSSSFYTEFSWFDYEASDAGFFAKYFDNFITWFAWFGNNEGTNIFSLLISIFEDIFSIFGLNIVEESYGWFSISSFIFYYSCYAIIYEFLSLFINIILWIPRFFRNRFQDVSEV